VRVGQWLNDNLGWEVGYSDLGSDTGRAVILGGAPEMDRKFSATAVHLAALGGMRFAKSIRSRLRTRHTWHESAAAHATPEHLDDDPEELADGRHTLSPCGLVYQQPRKEMSQLRI
jgi:hypothetical protein